MIRCMRFDGRTVVITGGGSGIGRVMATRFAAEGAGVAIADLDEARAREVAAEIEAAGGRALATRSDVTVSRDVDAMVEATEGALGPADVLVNNAYSCEGDNVALMEETTWARDLAGVVTSAFLCSKRVLPGMIERRAGVIVNIASVNGLAYVGNEAYSAGKAAMINLTQSIAVRYGHHGVRCVAVAPGSIATPAWQERVAKEPDVFDRLVKWYPLRRVGTPDDVASAALFLASDDASWITGTVLRVDGGLLAGNEVFTNELLVESREHEL
jgi:meso-butanediol dehydrogenase / (S,S)-butanediol dehydrogenase / diacetyl reductase